jgi:AraC-like DNA-binding protein
MEQSNSSRTFPVRAPGQADRQPDRKGQGEPTMSPQLIPVQSINDKILDMSPAAALATDRRGLLHSRLPARAAGGGVTISLEHLDVALAVSTEKEGPAENGSANFKVSATRLDRGAAVTEVTPSSRSSEDFVMERLSDALAATQISDDPNSAIYADALRLAILTRQFSRQADATPPTVETPSGRNVRSLQKWRLKRVVQYVDENLSAKITLQDLAAVAGLSRMHFAAQFRAAMGMRPHEYLLKRRIERAEELLKHTDIPLVEIALTVGFQTQAHFTTVFKRFAGDTPYQWRSAWLAQVTPLPSPRVSAS